MRTPITYYGGKQSLLKYLLPLIPPHKIYCEPFFGGGALFFAKPKSDVEVINDLNGEVVNFFKVVKTKFSELQKEIQGSPHSRELFKRAKAIYDFPDMFSDVQRAWAFWVLTNQGFAGIIGSWGFGKTNSKEKAVAFKRDSFTKEYADRMKTVQVEHNDALKVIDRCDDKTAFIYCDPPYINSDQGHYEGYSEAEYEALLNRLAKLKGKFLLSSYPNPILNKFIKKYKWRVKKISKSVAVTKLTDKQKVEMMVMNYEPTTLNLNGTETTNNIKKNDPYSGISKEVNFINRFLKFDGQIIYKKTFEIFIDELQNAIKEKKITKKSPVAKEILAIQEAAIKAYNSMKNAMIFKLRPATIKKLNGIIEKYENAYEDIDPNYAKSKKKSIGLDGINNPSPQVNIMPSTDFANLHFNTIGFKDRWLAFIGDPAPGFTAMVFGMPKMGKSYLCVDFAGYLARNHGKVLYVAKEEKLDKTLQDKLKEKDVAHENLTVADGIPADLSPYNFIFLDSVNKLGLTPKDLEKLKSENKGKSFVYVFQATKAGKFKGNNEFQHDVDVVIEVPEIGKAVQYGRFNQGGEMGIFPDSQEVGSPVNEEMQSLAGIKKKDVKEKLQKSKNKKLLVKSRGKTIAKKTQLGIPLEELAIEMLPEGADPVKIVPIIYNQTSRVEETATILAQQAMIDEKVKAKIKSLHFYYNDSDNISHGVSYFNVELEGTETELKKIAGEDKLFYCEW
ncbi:MAG: DNA adenine methylase [Bacteroidetes bacterium]|nr:DNA adenine methylase [Bacteroidota bacterium]